jgi:Cellulose-binding Sde182, nucleoside hydrolase-like domain
MHLRGIRLQYCRDSAYCSTRNNLNLPKRFSEGAKWIVKKAHEEPDQYLYVLVWGSITDVAQAIYHDPGIKKQIRIYSIGSWNTVQDQKARDYLYEQHRDLWWIENNSSFRGMYMGGYSDDSYGNNSFVAHYVKQYGALGKLFWEKKKDIKMGDTPSVLYCLHGDINNPEGESWGGSFQKSGHGDFYWTDISADSLIENGKHGAKTVNKFRKEYLEDWSVRMKWTISD